MPPLPLRIVTIFGTRPEAVKMAPVILELQKHPGEFEPVVVVTAQHRAMLDQILRGFRITPDHDLNIMQPGQTLTEITSRVLTGLKPLLEDLSPDAVLVQGDTTTVFAASLAAFYAYGGGKQIAVGHVEAGLRTDNKVNPYPEEMNRRLTTCLADVHFAPTAQARRNLLADGVEEGCVYVTGNTVIDALLYAAKELPPTATDQPSNLRTILVTAHRRENWGDPMRSLCAAIGQLVEKFADVQVLFAMHKNPVVRDVVRAELEGKERIALIEPPDYFDFVRYMRDAYLILTDSGGVQEEAPSLGKPVLVMRTTTERPEGVEAGTAKLVGTGTSDIVCAAGELLTSESAYNVMARAVNPYGDGRSSERIVAALRHHFGLVPTRPTDFHDVTAAG